MNPIILLITVIAHLGYFGFAIYMIGRAWINHGFGVAVVMFVLTWVIYPFVAMSFPLPKLKTSPPDQVKRRNTGRRR